MSIFCLFISEFKIGLQIGGWTLTALKANIDFQMLFHLCLKVIGLELVLASFPKGNLIFSKKGVESF